jgi:hypothetical protein
MSRGGWRTGRYDRTQLYRSSGKENSHLKYKRNELPADAVRAHRGLSHESALTSQVIDGADISDERGVGDALFGEGPNLGLSPGITPSHAFA